MEDSETTPLPPVLLQLSQTLEHKLHLIATGSQDIQHAALLATQYLFNHALQSENGATPHINQLLSAFDPAEAPQTRSKTSGKRKRSSSPPPVPKPIFQNTPLTGLFVDGMDQDQIWAQLDMRVQNVCDVLNVMLGEEDSLEGGSAGEIVSMDDEDDEESLLLGEEEGWSDELESEEDDDGEESEASEDEEQAETIAELRDPSSEEEEETASRKITLKLPGKRPKPSGHPELDDGFFSLVDFNTEIEAAEAKSSTRGRLAGSDGEDSDDDDDEEVDYFAPVDESQSGGDSQGEVQELYYNDFFGPSKNQRSSTTPASSSMKQAGKVRFHDEVRVKKIKAKGRSQSVSTLYGGEDDYEYDFGDLDGPEDESEQSDGMQFSEMHAGEADADGDNMSDADSGSAELGTGQDAIDRFKDDLFAEEEEDAQNDMTAHEKRMAALSKQIAELEAENVAPKEWVLMGEAGSRYRPQNSLLEEDLEFERVMKPVPLITEQTVHALEDQIKARILAGRFDDVVRVRPYEEKPFLPSRLFELKDTKSAQSLAQIYEDEYVAAQTGGVAGEDRDGKLRKEYEEIEKLWESISYKLDALSNVHFTPKQPKALISTVSNVPVATLESALPTAKSAKTMLAPEEVYGPSSSDPRARSEMAPPEKRSLHNKKRKAKKKTRDLLEKSVDKFAKMKSPKQQKQAALESVVKVGKGVTVVGKKPLKKRSRKRNEAG